MSAADFLDDSFPHGTVAGFRLGCRTNRLCATADSWLSCAAVHTRYASDWVFRKRVDSGATVAELVALDAADAVERAEQARLVRAVPKPKPKKRTKAEGGRAWGDEEIEQIKTRNAAGELDMDIAAVIGRPVASVTSKRRELGLPRNRRPRPFPHGLRGGYDLGCRDDSCPSTPSCGEVARKYFRELAAKRRRANGRPIHAARTHCRRNHELTPDNSFWKSDGRRRCVQCRTIQQNARREREKAAA